MLCCAMLCHIVLYQTVPSCVHVYVVLYGFILCSLLGSMCGCMQMLPSSTPGVHQARAAPKCLKAGVLRSPLSSLTVKSPWSLHAQTALPGKRFWMRMPCPAAAPTALAPALPKAPQTPSAPMSLPLLMAHLLTGRLHSAALLPRHMQQQGQGQAGLALL